MSPRRRGRSTSGRSRSGKTFSVREHPDTATTLHNLAGLLDWLGESAAARPLYQRALAIREEVLGCEHPFTATTLHNLASLLARQGEYAGGAVALQSGRWRSGRKSSAASTRIPRGRSTAWSCYLTVRVSTLRRDRTASGCSAIREKVLVASTPDTANALHNLASLLARQGEYAAARPLYERALAIREKVLGREHRSTATSLHNLASLLARQDKCGGRVAVSASALSIREQVFGLTHRSTEATREALSKCLEEMVEATRRGRSLKVGGRRAAMV